ncbi:MAG: hypothetical protein ACFFDW_03900, partial [Candidatus Thorarchaeota archaeon]
TILVIIGLLGYALWKTLIWCFAGKIILTSTTGLIAKFLYDTSFGQFFFKLFGLTEEKPKIWVSALAWIGTLVIRGVIMFLDWGDIWNKITRKTVSKKYKELSIKSQTITDIDALVAIPSNHNEELIPMKLNLHREDYLWQCVTKNTLDQYPDYHDMYALPYVLGQSKSIVIDSHWIKDMEKNLEEKNYQKASQLNLEKIILPKNLRENVTEEEISELTENLIYISFNLLHPEMKKKYQACLLLEKIADNKLKVRCIGEKEALVIKNIKSISPERILHGYINLLRNVATDPENVRKIDFAKYFKEEEIKKDE